MFRLIDFLIVRPITNLLFFIYNYCDDFGLSIIIFVILVKFCMWPLVKRQLYQTKLMKKIQPETFSLSLIALYPTASANRHFRRYSYYGYSAHR